MINNIYNCFNFDSITPMSKNWIGAWYLGFVVMSFMCFLLAIPILAFPKSLPGSEKLEKQSEAHNENFSGQKQTFTKIKEIPKALCLLLKNPTFFFLNLAGASGSSTMFTFNIISIINLLYLLL